MSPCLAAVAWAAAAPAPRRGSSPVTLRWDEAGILISGCSGITWKITAVVPSSLSARLTVLYVWDGEGWWWADNIWGFEMWVCWLWSALGVKGLQPTGLQQRGMQR